MVWRPVQVTACERSLPLPDGDSSFPFLLKFSIYPCTFDLFQLVPFGSSFALRFPPYSSFIAEWIFGYVLVRQALVYLLLHNRPP